MSILKLAEDYLKNQIGDISGIVIQPWQTNWGMVVYFYYEETGVDLKEFITIPMLQDLLNGKDPKKVKNKYLK